MLDVLGDSHKDINLKPLLKKIALDILGAGALGREFGLLQGREEEYPHYAFNINICDISTRT